MAVTEFLQVLHDSEIGTSLRESLYMFPLIEGIHLVGLALSVGLIFFVDLKFIGVFLKDVHIKDILQPLRPWLITGFALTFITGFLLIWAEGPRIYEIPVFPWKLAFIALAGANAVWFEYRYGRNISTWGQAKTFPRGVQLAGWVSLLSWSAVVVCGRLIPYLDSAH
jgi:hypothetical protein